jgi:hypothetical protein
MNYPTPSENMACKEQIRVLAKLVGAGSRLLDSLHRVHFADPEIWRHAQSFRLFQAACLFANIEPGEFSIVERPGPARAWFHVLGDAWDANELEKVPSDDANLRITTRQSLQNFVTAHHITRPPFLDDV